MDSVLDMSLCEELKLGVCATADGGVSLFSMEDGQFFVGLMLFQGFAARSVAVVKHDEDRAYSVICGGSDGTIHRVPLIIDPKSGRVDEENPFGVSETTNTALKPKHVGPVTTMVSPGDDMFVTGGQDGALRVWSCSDQFTGSRDDDGDDKKEEQSLKAKCIYALTGYKLWLGCACTDGKRLISDGGDSSVIIRDFSREPETKGKASL
jgi:WD40 repeat protein